MRPVQGGQILEVANLGRVNGQRIMNVWHYRWVGAPSPVEDGDAIVALLQPTLQGGLLPGLLDGLRAMCAESVHWEGIRYQWIWPVRYAPVFSPIDSGDGADPLGQLPQNVAGVVTLQSIFGGPGSTGRKHFGGLTTGAVTNGLMSNNFIIDANAIMDVMKTTIDTAAIQPASALVPVIYDRVDPTISIPWLTYTVQATSRVMRRRTVGVGE